MIALLALLVLLAAAAAPAATFTVDSTADTADDTPGDASCATSGAVCTLRAAIEEVNAGAGNDTVAFSIGGGAGKKLITLGSALPVLTANGTMIDGLTQAGAASGDLWNGTPPSPMIAIDADGHTNAGLRVSGDGVTIRGIEIFDVAGSNSSGYGIVVNGGGGIVRGCVVHGSFGGIFMNGSTPGIMGGPAAGDGNLVYDCDIAGLSVNSNGNTVEGNFSGVGPDLVTPAPSNQGIFVEGGDENVLRANLTSGNTVGIAIASNANDTTVEGNFIGVTRLGADLGCNPLEDNDDGTTATDNTFCAIGCCVFTGASPACATAVEGVGVPAVSGGHCVSAENVGAQTATTCAGQPEQVVGIPGDPPPCAGDDITIARFVPGETCADGCIGPVPTATPTPEVTPGVGAAFILRPARLQPVQLAPAGLN